MMSMVLGLVVQTCWRSKDVADCSFQLIVNRRLNERDLFAGTRGRNGS